MQMVPLAGPSATAARGFRWLRVGGHPRWPGRAGGVGGGKRPARGRRHGEQESSSASLTAELRVMVLAAPPLPGHCGERSNVSEECIRRGKPAESSCSPQNLQLLPRVSGWKRRKWLVAYQGWYLCWQWMCRFPAASPFAVAVAGGGGVAAMSKTCARILTPTCGAYVAHVVWVLCFSVCLSCRCLPLHRAPLVFCQQRWCHFVFRSASLPLC